MPKTKLFIGSSTAARSQARAVVEKFTSKTLTFIPWWDYFTAGRTLLEDLDGVVDQVDGALMLFSPEASSTVRGGASVSIPNLNVLFEFGYFYGALGKERVAIMKYGNYYLPSDLGGYIHITGSKFFERNKVVQVGRGARMNLADGLQAYKRMPFDSWSISL